MTCLGMNVYCWAWEAQNRLLAECLAPEVRGLCAEGLIRRFWFDRFDARGPHVFGLLTLPAEAFPEVSERLVARLDEHLAAHPSRDLPRERLQEFHDATRNRKLCSADGLPGIAANNSYILFEHGSTAYPFSLSAGLPGEEELWQLLHDFSLWAVDWIAVRTDTRPISVAVRWAAELAGALRAAGQAAAYWRYHASTLILGLKDRQVEAEVEGALPRAIGEKNFAAFSRLWSEVEASGPVWPLTGRLVEVALTEAGRPENRRFALLREVVHSGFKQLGLSVVLEIPLVLFAWHDSLGEEGLA
jgi:hypothetical protein